MPITWKLGSSPSGLIPSTVRRINQPKSPKDLIPVAGDFRASLAAIDCDVIDFNYTPTTAVMRNDGGAPDLFVVGTPAINSDLTRVTVWLAGGSAGSEYMISISIRSADGQYITRSFIIPVAIR